MSKQYEIVKKFGESMIRELQEKYEYRKNQIASTQRDLKTMSPSFRQSLEERLTRLTVEKDCIGDVIYSIECALEDIAEN